MARQTQRGVTLTEMVAAAAILGLLFSLIAPGMNKMLRSASRSTMESRGLQNIQSGLAVLETDLEEMALITEALADQLVFQLDSNSLPGYSGNADADGDGIRNDLDPDDDNDRITGGGGPVIPTLFNGNDLWDQDDGNDGKIDAQFRYRRDANGDLIRETNFNEAGWGDRRLILKECQAGVFSYFGSINHTPPFQNTSNVTVDLNKDQIITENEIDSSLGGPGNDSGVLDTPEELIYIDSIQISLTQGKPGAYTFQLKTRIRPPLISTNRRV